MVNCSPPLSGKFKGSHQAEIGRQVTDFQPLRFKDASDKENEQLAEPSPCWILTTGEDRNTTIEFEIGFVTLLTAELRLKVLAN